MTKLWALLLLLIATACNVANEPKPLATAGVSDSLGTMTLANGSLTRNEGSGVVSLVVSISRALTEPLNVAYTMSGTATGGPACTAGIDYIAPTGTVYIGPGARTGVVDITLCPDNLFETNENMILTLVSSVPSLTIGTNGVTTVTIIDASVPPPVSFAVLSSGSIAEGEVSNTVVPVDIELLYPSVFPVTVDILTSGAATLGVDYALSANRVTFPPGTTSTSVFVTVIADTVVELNEDIVLSLFNPFNATIGSVPSHTIQIAADETPNPIQVTMIGITPQAENVVGDVNMVMQVNGVTDHPITIKYAVDEGAAPSAARRATFGVGGDVMFPAATNVGGIRTASNGKVVTMTLPAFTSGFINLPIRILDDTIYERDESARIQLLGGPEVALSGTTFADIVINDNETAPTVGFVTTSQTVVESNDGRIAVVRLLNSSGVEVTAGEPVVVSLSTANLTTNSVPGRSDWTMGLSSVTIPEGQSRATVPFAVPIDLVDEDNESFRIDIAGLTATYAITAASGAHTVSIVDADPSPKVGFETLNYVGTAGEATAGALAVNLVFDALSERSVTVNYNVSGVDVSNAACGAGQDVSTTGSVTVPPNSAMPFAITGLSLCDDSVYEGDETARLTLVSVTNALLGTSLTHMIPIVDDEAAPAMGVTASSAFVDEAAQTVTFNVSVAATGKPFTFTYATTGTALIGQDHTLPANGIVSVSASTGPQVIPLSFQITDDVIAENAETIILTVTVSATDANLVTPSATMTINTNDGLKLALGSRHACGLLSGQVKCWGHGPSIGQGTTVDYGDTTGEDISALQPIALGVGFAPVKVVTGFDFSCALSSSGTVKCWGLNNLGQLGQDRPGIALTSSEYVGDEPGEMGDSLPAVSLGGTVVDIQSSSDANHACALFASGRMKCWGQNNFGQLGYDFPITPPVGDTCSDADGPNNICRGDEFGDVAGLDFLVFPGQPAANVVRMTVGFQHTCAQLTTGVVQCWGRNVGGALGIDNNLTASYLQHSVSTDLTTAITFSGAPFLVPNMIALEAGVHKTCGTFNNAGVHSTLCWGLGSDGALGQGTTTNIGDGGDAVADITTPVAIAPFTALKSGAKPGLGHTCARGADEVNPNVFCWGDNSEGQHGDGTTAGSNAPNTAVAIGPYTDVYVGSEFTCATDGAFQFTCWGLNTEGNLGTADTVSPTAPGTSVDFL